MRLGRNKDRNWVNEIDFSVEDYSRELKLKLKAPKKFKFIASVKPFKNFKWKFLIINPNNQFENREGVDSLELTLWKDNGNYPLINKIPEFTKLLFIKNVSSERIKIIKLKYSDGNLYFYYKVKGLCVYNRFNTSECDYKYNVLEVPKELEKNRSKDYLLYRNMEDKGKISKGKIIDNLRKGSVSAEETKSLIEEINNKPKFSNFIVLIGTIVSVAITIYLNMVTSVISEGLNFLSMRTSHINSSAKALKVISSSRQAKAIIKLCRDNTKVLSNLLPIIIVLGIILIGSQIVSWYYTFAIENKEWKALHEYQREIDSKLKR